MERCRIPLRSQHAGPSCAKSNQIGIPLDRPSMGACNWRKDLTSSVNIQGRLFSIWRAPGSKKCFCFVHQFIRDPAKDEVDDRQEHSNGHAPKPEILQNKLKDPLRHPINMLLIKVQLYYPWITCVSRISRTAELTYRGRIVLPDMRK